MTRAERRRAARHRPVGRRQGETIEWCLRLTPGCPVCEVQLWPDPAFLAELFDGAAMLAWRVGGEGRIDLPCGCAVIARPGAECTDHDHGQRS